MISLKICFFLLFQMTLMSAAWKAIPANQAMYASKSSEFGIARQSFQPLKSDETLPRDQLNHIYKFGWCTPDSFKKQFLRKSMNMTLPTWESTQLNYIYLIAKKHTMNYKLQCVVMKAYVPTKYQFYKSRLPLYYCQGIVFIIMLNTINRYEIHEFYLHSRLNMPISFTFEFYQPTWL